ncbi:MAG: UDP-N-acetylmuramate dehydrogenase [Firmicutes bacterium]|nr:UDP-N-acetylmuramate dehydrogenase [Bacillota bacterium]
MDWAQISRELGALIQGEVKVSEPMRKHTSLRVGGTADLLVFPKGMADLRTILELAQDRNVPLRVIGNGTNILVPDEGLKGITVSITEGFKGIAVSGGRISIEAGRSLGSVVRTAVTKGLGGLTFAGGIPGTVGGAVVMNAGAFGADMSQVVKAVEALSFTGRLKRYRLEELGFGYRTSVFQDHEKAVITRVAIELEPASPEELRAQVREYAARRRTTQPQAESTAGSVFRNPPGDSAGRLLEEVGAKGMRIGDAQISPVHANFIVNLGRAKSAEVKALLEETRAMVEKSFGIRLEPEIVILS